MTWAVETTALTKRFPKTTGWRGLFSASELARPAVGNVDLRVRQGELFGLLGPNGAGKTTLVKILSTLIQPTSGSAHVNGYALGQDGAIKASIGLVTSDERSFYWRLTGRQNLEFFARLHGIPANETSARVAAVLEKMELEAVADQRFLVYSTGMRQRLSIARALLNQPRLMFLDEPTQGLDPIMTRHLRQLIRSELVERQGITVLLTTHGLEEAELLCDRIAIMHQGSLRAVGTIDELRGSLRLGGRTLIQVASLPEGAHSLLALRLPQAQIRPQPEAIERENKQGMVDGIWIELPLPGDAGTGGVTEGVTEPEAPTNALNAAIDLLRQAGADILSVTPAQTTLEEIFDLHAGSQSQGLESASAKNENAPPADRPKNQIEPAISNTAPLPPPKAPSLWSVFPAFLRRDLLQEASYRLSFFLQFINIFFSVLIFYFISQLLGEAAAPYLEAYGGDYFSFVLIGIAFMGYFSTGLSSFSNSLRHSQTTGTLEAMLTTPTRLSSIIIASSLWDYLETTLRVLVYLGVGVFFMQSRFGDANYLAALVVIILTVITASSLGIISASFIMVVKRGDPINWAFSTLTAFLGGVYYPVAILPPAFEWISRLLPITYSLHAMRLALLQGASWAALLPDILALIVFSIVLMPLGLRTFRYAVQKAKKEGSLTHY